MTVLIDWGNYDNLKKELEFIFEKIVVESLNQEGFQKQCEISISIVNNQEIRQINKQFRRIDKETDVLSFPQLSFIQEEEEQTNEKGEVILGDIIISMEKAEEQASEYGHSVNRELAFLTAHSMLHLLGYDHMNEEDEKEMFLKQKNILLAADFPRK